MLTFGDVALRLSPPAGDRLSTADRLAVHATGPECNAAVAAGSTGVTTTHAAVLPDGPLGRRAARALRERDVDVRATYREGRQALEFHERGAGVRGATDVADRASCAFGTVTEGDLPLDAVRAADATYFTGAVPGESTAAAEAAARFVRAADEGGATTALGLGYRPDQWDPAEAREALTGFFPAVDVFIAREADVTTVFDRDGQPGQVAHALAHEHGFETVVLVRDRTSVAWHDATMYEFDVLDTETVDPSGEVDALVGTFLARLLQGADTETALRDGTAARALARTVDGPLATFTPAELERAAAAVDGD